MLFWKLRPSRDWMDRWLSRTKGQEPGEQEQNALVQQTTGGEKRESKGLLSLWERWRMRNKEPEPTALECALVQWKIATERFQAATEPEWVELTAFELEAARRRYTMLLRREKSENVQPRGMVLPGKVELW